MISLALSILAQTSAPPPQGPSFLVPIACFVAVFYFVVLRPQQKREKEIRARVAALKTGDKVVTSGGIHGMVANVKDGPTLILKIADNVKIEVDKTAILLVEGAGAGSAKELPAKVTVEK